MMLVILSEWEMGCCGYPFDVDDEVNWLLERIEPRLGRLAAELGGEAVAQVTWHFGGMQDPDDEPDEPFEKTTARIRRIWKLYTVYDRRKNDNGTSVPRDGSETIVSTARAIATGENGGHTRQPQLDGWVIDIDPLDEVNVYRL